MISRKHLGSKLLILSSVFLLTSCASVVHNIVESSVLAVADAFQGYRVQYYSIPAGAKIVCDGEEKGEAPFFMYYDITPEQKTNQVMEIDNCQAIWPSGALAEIKTAIPLTQYPRFVNLTTERPADAPGYDTDEAFGDKTLALRQKQLDDLAAAADLVVGFGFAVYQANKASSVTSRSSYVPSPSVSGPGSIRWNWIQPSTIAMPIGQPNFGIQGGVSNNALTPIFPASSCVGTILMGKCVGSIVDRGDLKHFCAGTFVNGRCLGSVLF